MILKELRSKNWIEWVKIIVAIDIASVGIGLILDIDSFHILADLFGRLSHILFGVLYVFVATLIFKRVFPHPLFEEGEKPIDAISEKMNAFSEKTVTKAHKVVQKGKKFVEDRYDEVRDEFEKISKE